MNDYQLALFQRKVLNAVTAVGPVLVLLAAIQASLPRWAQAALAALTATCLWVNRNWTSAKDLAAPSRLPDPLPTPPNTGDAQRANDPPP